VTVDVSQLTRDLKARLAELDRELAGFDALQAERERIRTALERLDAPATPSRARGRAASGERSSPKRRGSRRRSRGKTREQILSYLAERNGPGTASEVAAGTGLPRATVSTTMSRLAKDGALDKAERGYRVAGSPSSDAPSG
jgi:DNA-binding transcriptional ArsR family regulator